MRFESLSGKLSQQFTHRYLLRKKREHRLSLGVCCCFKQVTVAIGQLLASWNAIFTFPFVVVLPTQQHLAISGNPYVPHKVITGEHQTIPKAFTGLGKIRPEKFLN
jgi:hypothetical protein